MKVKFFGQPNMLVKDRKRIPFSTEWKFKPLFRFDEDGEFVTEDEKLIERLKRKFKYEVENNVEFKCKQCDYTTTNKGELLAHYRKEHPKE